MEDESLYDTEKEYVLEIVSQHKQKTNQTYLEKTKSYSPYFGWN